MKFHEQLNAYIEQLNAYIEQLDCMAKEVSELSGISAATLSRYRTGSRVPNAESDAFENLCSAIAELAERKRLADITAESVRGQFMQTSDLRSRDTDRLLENFDILLATHWQTLPSHKLRCLDGVPVSQRLASPIGSREVRIVRCGIRGARIGFCSRQSCAGASNRLRRRRACG